MKKYEYKAEEKLIEIRADKVWLENDLLPQNSDFNLMFPVFWEAINEEINLHYRGFRFELKNIKKFILNGSNKYIIYIHTESKTSSSTTYGQRAYLTNREIYIDITGLMIFTNLCGCKFQRLHSPFEDFINEFIGEVYF
jgi:hypothetical protein